MTNCDLSWPCNVGGPTAAGIAGEASNGRRQGNWIHDIHDPSGFFQNHSIYIGTNTQAIGAAQADYHSITRFNCITDITGGSGIQSRGPDVSAGAVADSAPWISIHHNWFDNLGKHGINIFDHRNRAQIWANVILNANQVGFFTNSDNVSTVDGIYFGFNTIVNWGSLTYYPGIYWTSGAGGGSIKVESNVIAQLASRGAPVFSDGPFFSTAGGLPADFNKNIWYDINNVGAKPSGDTLGSLVNPQFTNSGTGNYTPAAGSPLLNAGITPPTNVLVFPIDLLGLARPQGSATKWAIGAIERAGG